LLRCEISSDTSDQTRLCQRSTPTNTTDNKNYKYNNNNYYYQKPDTTLKVQPPMNTTDDNNYNKFYNNHYTTTTTTTTTTTDQTRFCQRSTSMNTADDNYNNNYNYNQTRACSTLNYNLFIIYLRKKVNQRTKLLCEQLWPVKSRKKCSYHRLTKDVLILEPHLTECKDALCQLQIH